MGPTDRRRDRGVSVQVNYITSLGITTILVVGLLMTTGSFVDNQTKRAGSHELEAIGNRIATQIDEADDLAARGGRVSVTIHQPRKVVGRAYSVRLGHGSVCSSPIVGTDDCLLLEAKQPGILVKVPVVNTTNVNVTSTGLGTFRVTATPSNPTTSTAGGGAATNVGMTVGVGRDVGSGATNGSDLDLANNQPVAKFTLDPGAPTAGWETTFTSQSRDPDGTITKYEWDLDGDGTAEGTGESFAYAYSTPGRYNATLTVMDDNGVKDSSSKTIVVGGLAYQSDAVARDYHGSGTPGGLAFNVTNVHGVSAEILEMHVEPDADIDKFEADAGNGKGGKPIFVDTDSGNYVAVRKTIDVYDDGVIVDFEEAGPPAPIVDGGETFQITLSEFYQGGSQFDMTDEPVTIGLRYRVGDDYYVSKFDLTAPYNVPPIPDFDVTCTGKECEFDASASSDPDGSVTNYQWKFGDGSGDTGQVRNHTYAANGSYSATVTVTDDNGTSTSLTKLVDVGGLSFDLAVNFQPAGAPVPSGYLVDSGESYGTRASGHTYGWMDDPASSGGSPTVVDETADRNAYASTNQEYDTFNRMEESGNSRTWEVDVPNGRYRVYAAMGDPDPPGPWWMDDEPINDVVIEGTSVPDPDGESNHNNYTAVVDVTDGRLSISPGSSADDPNLHFVEVTAIDTQSFDEEGGRVVLEAEHFQQYEQGNDDDDGDDFWDNGDDMNGHAWWRVTDSDASNNRALEVTPAVGDRAGDTENGPRLNYTVDFDTTGTYYVWVRMQCPTWSSDSVHVGLDGSPQSYGGQGLTDGCNSASGWTWVNRVDGSLVTVDVSTTGVHTVNVWAREDGTMIDKIVVTDEPPATYQPSGEGPDESDRN